MDRGINVTMHICMQINRLSYKQNLVEKLSWNNLNIEVSLFSVFDTP